MGWRRAQWGVVFAATLVSGCGDDGDASSGGGGGAGASGSTSAGSTQTGSTSTDTSTGTTTSASTGSGDPLPGCGVWSHETIHPDVFHGGRLTQTAAGTWAAAWVPDPEDIFDKEIWVATRGDGGWTGVAVAEVGGFQDDLVAVGDTLHLGAIEGFDASHFTSEDGLEWTARAPLTVADADVRSVSFLEPPGGRLLALLVADDDEFFERASLVEVIDEGTVVLADLIPETDCYLGWSAATLSGMILSIHCDFGGSGFVLFDGEGFSEVHPAPGPLTSIASSPDGTHVVASTDMVEGDCSRLTLWNLEGTTLAAGPQVDVCDATLAETSLAVNDAGRVTVMARTFSTTTGVSSLLVATAESGVLSAWSTVSEVSGDFAIWDLELDAETGCPAVIYQLEGSATNELRFSLSRP